MLKVNYPQTKKETDVLHTRYLKCFTDRLAMQKILDKIWDKLDLKGSQRFSIDYILTAPIEKLVEISLLVNEKCKNKPQQKEALKKLFNYDKLLFGKKYQPIIADFFMSSTELNAATCYFCNIDHIYSFRLLDDFKSGLDLVVNGTAKDLERIKGIGKTAAEKISNQRAGLKSLASLKNISPTLIKNIENLDVKERNNLFTLDHVLDKATHPVAALSLYNFVPCCYSCNSKFKRSLKLIDKNPSISPTSKDFSFGQWVRFKLFFPLEFGKTYKDIKDTGDFVLNFEIDKDSDEYENYLRVFRLRARYVFHKREVLNLVQKRKSYSDSQIAEIAKLTKRTTMEIKRDVFGAELFEESPDSKPLTKLKRDIAIDIGIKDVAG